MANLIIPNEGVLLGRARVPGFEHPRIVTVRGTELVDITAKGAPMVRDIAELANPADYVAKAPGKDVRSQQRVLPAWCCV